MAAEDNLDALRDLYQDLIELANSQLPVIDGLLLSLEAHIENFRKLLDKPGKNDTSRDSISSGTIEIDGTRYNVNADFQEEAKQVADGLDLDELESARLLLLGRESAEALDRPPLACAVLHFHDTRRYLLECLRLLLKQSQDVEQEEEVRDALLLVISIVLETRNGPARNGSLFARKCITTMAGCEMWLQSLSERVQCTVTLGQTTTPVLDEIMGYQQDSLNDQHELLAAIVVYLVKGDYTSVEDFHQILDHMPTLDRWGSVAVHYVPILTSMAWQYGYSDGTSIIREARSINTKILESRDSRPWALPHLQAAMTTWWLAEYSGWYHDQVPGSPEQGVDPETEAQSRSDAFLQALHDGAFQCTLSIVSQRRFNDVYDSIKGELTRLLLGDTPALSNDPARISFHFRELLMEQFESFADAFISHMPDTLRRFKVEEDDQRRRLLSGLQANVEDAVPEHDRHLERFLLIMCYAYEGRSEAAESFWSDTDGNLYGFLQWASRRQSTPCVSAFCELFRSISTGNDCASAAHKFLLEESSATTGRHRRTISLSWTQIFEELEFYASRIRDHTTLALPPTHSGSKPKQVEVDEPESPVMLECYLRLTSHLCAQSAEIRAWILTNSSFRIIDTLFSLCGSTIPARIRACTYLTFCALLTEKSPDLGYHIWIALDQWVCAGFSNTASGPRPSKSPSSSGWAEGLTFKAISSSFEEADAFVSMLQSLIAPPVDITDLRDTLPFPEQLGSSNRMPGVEPYVDLVMGTIFANVTPQLGDPQQIQILSATVLHFVETSLRSFNEDLIVIANNPKTSLNDSKFSSSLSTYARLHPFGRTMEWLFNDGVLKVLFSSAHQNIHEVTKSTPEAPLLLMILRCVRVMCLLMDLQSTYFDIIRPMIDDQSSGRRHSVINPSLSSFEDAVSTNLQLIVDIGLYCGSGHEDLILASLELLERFSVSRRLNVTLPSQVGSRIASNKLVAVLRQNNYYEPIARSLVGLMEIGRRELNDGPLAPSYNAKLAVLNFLHRTLVTSPERPNIAHLLLGFECVGDSLSIASDGLFANRMSLFHTVLQLAVDYPDSAGGTMLAWSLVLKEKTMQTLEILWTSSLTSIQTLMEMREGGILFAIWTSQIPIEPATKWNLLSMIDPGFFLDEGSAVSVVSFLGQRRLLFEYVSAELLMSAEIEDSSLRAQVVSTLFGSTQTVRGVEPNMTVFDMLDFLDLDLTDAFVAPELHFLADLDLVAATDYDPHGSVVKYNLIFIEQIIDLKYKSLFNRGQIHDDATYACFQAEKYGMLHYLQSENRRHKFARARISALKGWVDLAALVLQAKHIDDVSRSAFVLLALQIVTPKLEIYASEVRPEALLLARFSQTLLDQFDCLGKAMSDSQRSGDIANDRLLQLFRIALRAIPNPNGDEIMREVLYSICSKYLAASVSTAKVALYAPNHIRYVKAGGSKLLDNICDDAYGSEGTCRVAAVLLLDALTELAAREKSSFVIDTFTRSNFIVVLVESINGIQEELLSTSANNQELLLTYYESKFALLLTISLSRDGATKILNSNLYTAIRSSGLCSVDIDIGFDIDDPEAIQKYRRLLLAVLRIISSIVVSCGTQNQQAIEQARGFLVEYRSLIVAACKRQANIGSRRGDNASEDGPLDQIVEYFVLLAHVTGFLKYEETQGTRKPKDRGYS